MRSEWPTVPLGELVEMSADKIATKSIPEKCYVSTDSMLPDFGGISFNRATPSVTKTSSFSKDDILFSNIRTYFRKLWIADKNGGCSNDVIVFRSKENVHPKFMFYSLMDERFIQHTVQTSKGTKMPRGDKSAIIQYDTVLPPLPEQKAIAHILGSLDDKIELNRKMNATLEGMAQALFKSWFVDFDPVIDNALAAGNPIPDELADRAVVRRQALADGTANREAAKPFPDSFQETDELSWIPKGWEVRPIEDCIKRFPAGKKYETKTAEETGAVPILDQGKSGFIGFHNDEPGVKASPDDPIIVFANHTCYMRLIMFDFSAIQNVLPFKGEGLNIFWLFEATKGRQQFNEYKGHWPDFVIKKLVVPTLPLVSIFGEIIELNHQKIYANELKNQSLTKLRDTLLPKLISGELRMPEVKQLTNETLT